MKLSLSRMLAGAAMALAALLPAAAALAGGSTAAPSGPFGPTNIE